MAGRRMLFERPLTRAERTARCRVREIDRHREDLEAILEAHTKPRADVIALAALARLDERQARADAKRLYPTVKSNAGQRQHVVQQNQQEN
jgi:hypothetical protein